MLSALIVGCALNVTAADGPAPADLAAYQAARTAAGRDADAHVALALWCEAHGMAAEKSKHLARAVLLDPSNAKARGLLGFVNHDGAWMRPGDVTRAVEESPERQAVFKEYQERRVKARDTADDQNKLARWCDEHGLAQQATAHFHRVELDPGRDLAWKHLGFKKVKGQWVKPGELAAEKTEREAQAKADKHWKSRLDKLKDALSSSSKSKQAEAREELAKIDDPRAVPAVWAVFAEGGEQWQPVALQLFGQIDSPRSSVAMATMAVFSSVANIRSEAAQRLTRCDPRDYAMYLTSLLRDEIKYKIKPVEGPGSQGKLFVEGKDANVMRRYTPFQTPVILPGDIPGIDDYGRYVINRSSGFLYLGSELNYNQFLKATNPQSAPNAAFASALTTAGLSPDRSKALAAQIAAPSKGTLLINGPNANLPPASLNYREIRAATLQIPMEAMIADAQESALMAQRQLARDVQQIESYNTPIREVNERASVILRGISGQDLGTDSEKWAAWATDLQGYAFQSSVPTSTPPTITMDVPLNYQPQVVPTVVSRVVGYQRSHSCFAAGTSVRTLRGARPIETIQPGDQVLTEDTSTGALQYRPVVTAYHNPPNETYKLDLGKEAIVATGIHRFWKAGRGWVMARDVKAGDQLRTVGGLVEVVAVTKDKVQPVFNLQLDGGDDFCVGELGVIAHDNSLIDPVEHPFDGVPALAELGAKPAP